MNNLNNKCKNQYFIKDPIHNYITIKYDIIDKLIQCKELQRLRHINQLGVAQYVYPAATHTRFSHSLGTYEIAQKICNNTYFHKRVYERVLFQCASLLHDIGHGPISHSFEEVIDNFDHEAMGVQILKDENSDVSKVLTSYDSNLISDISDLLLKKSKYKSIQTLISSDIDVDRMDYLLRDSYQTSLSLGSYDLGRIIYGLNITKEGVHFNMNSLNVLEDFLLSRVHMYNQVYSHRKSIISDKIVTLLLRKKILKNEDNKLNKFNTKRDNETFNKLTDHTIFDLLIDEKDEELKILSNALVYRSKKNIIKISKETKVEGMLLLYDPDNIKHKKIYNGGINIKIQDKIVDLEEVSLIIKQLNNTVLKIQGEYKYYARIKN